MPGLHDGDFDHFALDLAGQRLFLAAEDNSAVEVLDLRTNKLIHTINGPKKPHSLAYRADLKKLFVVDGDARRQVEIYEGDSYRASGSIPLAANADSAPTILPASYCTSSMAAKAPTTDYCLISVIDTTSGKKAGRYQIDSDSLRGDGARKVGTAHVRQYSTARRLWQ